MICMKSKPVMTREEARAWKERWRAMRELEIEELRNTPMETKFRQLAAMMQSARVLGWRTSTPEEIERVRRLWVRLKSAVHDAG